MIEHFAPNAGGVENVAWQVAHELARVGEDVTILTRNAEHAAAHKETAPEASLHEVTVQRVRVPSAWQPLRVIAFSQATASAARRGIFDIVHSFSRTRRQDLYRAGGGSHHEYLRHNHSNQGAMLRRFSPRHRVILSIEAGVFGDSTQRIQCASRFVAEALIADHGVSRNRILLLPNAVDSERFGSPSALEAGRRLRIELDEKAEQIWLLPASGWRRKGLPLLFQALASIRDPRIHLWIAGRDDPRPWRRMASELGLSNQVLFMGQRDDLEVVYAAVDGMVLPTRYDAFANVTLEAAASGLPVITTQTNGAAEWLEAGLVLLEHADDLAGLVRALTTFADSERRIDFGRRAQEQARRLTWARHVEQLRDEYRRIVDAREVRKYR